MLVIRRNTQTGITFWWVVVLNQLFSSTASCLRAQAPIRPGGSRINMIDKFFLSSSSTG